MAEAFRTDTCVIPHNIGLLPLGTFNLRRLLELSMSSKQCIFLQLQCIFVLLQCPVPYLAHERCPESAHFMSFMAECRLQDK